MKVIVNVPQDLLAAHQRWTSVQGVKLEETKDGSFDLCVTLDLAKTREAEEAIRRVLNGEPA